MRAVRGVVASAKRASLSEAASFASAFAGAAAAGEEARPDVAAAGEEARPDVAAYIRRFRSALDELVRLHREVDPCGGGEAENTSGRVEAEVGDVGARVLGSEEARRMRKKKKRKREEFDGERSGFDGDLERKKKKKKEKEKRYGNLNITGFSTIDGLIQPFIGICGVTSKKF